jgi:hypothetical protein
MMKQLSYCLCAVALWSLILCGCSKDDKDYIDFVKKDNLIYLGKVDSIQAFSGHNRVKLSWKLPLDPNVTKLRVYWNNRKDSVQVAVPGDKRPEKMDVIVNGLTEGKQSLEVITFDDAGNKSVPTEVLAEAFGGLYISSLLPRAIRNAELIGTASKLQFFKPDADITTTELRYTDVNSNPHSLVLFNSDSLVTLTGFPAGGTFEYRSWFRPDSTSIDTLAPVWITSKVKEDISPLYLKNNKYPFAYSTYDGTRYGSLKDWTENTASKQKGPGKIYGAYDSQTFALSKTLAADGNIADGKVTQTITLPAGKYELVWTNEGLPAPDNTGTQARFLAVSAGTDLPNVAQINATTTLGYVNFVGLTIARAPFTLTEEKKVTIGVAVSFSTAPQSFKTYEIRLLKVPQ